MMMMMMIPAGDNSSIVHQSSLAAQTSGVSRRNGRRSEHLAFSVFEMP
jgi:hypothetical protein